MTRDNDRDRSDAGRPRREDWLSNVSGHAHYHERMSGRLLLLGSLLLVALIAGAVAFGLLTSGGSAGPSVSMEELEEREVIHLVEDHVIFVLNDGDPLALSDDAQHVGDTVIFCESSRLFESLAHGEKFDILGHYFGGPAARGLARYPVIRDGDLVRADMDQEIEGPARGDVRTVEPAGDFCV